MDDNLASATKVTIEQSDRLAASLAALGLLITAFFGWISPEGLFHFDDLTHYLYAKWSWRWPAYLLNDWGRPGFTALYALPAYFGWPMCRALSAILSAFAAWLAYRIAQRAGLRWPWAVVPLCFAQPLYFQLAQTTLTETAHAFYLTAAVYLAQRNRWSLSSALLSLAFVTRHEAAVFLPVWVFFAWRQRVPFWRLWPIVWAPLIVNLLAPLAGITPLWQRLAASESSGQYGRGGWLTYFCRSMEAFGPAIAVLAISGWPALLLRRAGAMAAASIGVYFAAQTVIRALGLYDSGGYARFLVGISPLVAIAALAGINNLLHADLRRRAWTGLSIALAMVVLWIAMRRQIALQSRTGDILAEIPRLDQARIAIHWVTGSLAALSIAGFVAVRMSFAKWLLHLMPAALAVIMVLTCRELCRPLRPPPEAPIIDETLAWLKENGRGDVPLISSIVWIDYKTQRMIAPVHESTREALDRAPVGAVFAWDRQFASSPDHRLPLDEFLNSPSYRLIHSTRPRTQWENEPYLRLFEKVKPVN